MDQSTITLSESVQRTLRQQADSVGVSPSLLAETILTRWMNHSLENRLAPEILCWFEETMDCTEEDLADALDDSTKTIRAYKDGIVPKGPNRSLVALNVLIQSLCLTFPDPDRRVDWFYNSTVEPQNCSPYCLFRDSEWNTIIRECNAVRTGAYE